jgi:creatinine amidohydrolase
MNFETCSWTVIQAKLAGSPIGIVPISPLEEHGPHLPVSTDYYISYELARRAADKTGILCLPPIILGSNRKSFAYPGTVSISSETLALTIMDMWKSLRATGFHEIIFVSGHCGSGQLRAFEQVTREINDPGIHCFNLLQLLDKEMLDELIETPHDDHAGEMETSMMLYLDPSHVHMEKAAQSFPSYPEEATAQEFMHSNPSGVNGDPTKATREKGKIIVDQAVRQLTKFIREIAAHGAETR